MILIIPTDDGISISPDIKKAENFRLMITLNGIIKSEEIKRTGRGGIEGLLDTIKYSGGDQEKGLVNLIIRSGNSADKIPSYKGNFRIFTTKEDNITNAIISFLKEKAFNESDYICQP